MTAGDQPTSDVDLPDLGEDKIRDQRIARQAFTTFADDVHAPMRRQDLDVDVPIVLEVSVLTQAERPASAAQWDVIDSRVAYGWGQRPAGPA